MSTVCCFGRAAVAFFCVRRRGARVVGSGRSPALAKWAQWAAVRTDMFPEGLCQKLSALQSATRLVAFLTGYRISDVFKGTIRCWPGG